MPKIIALSDTHGIKPTLPHGDILIHAGDVCGFGTMPEFRAFCAWYGAQPHPHKILVAGNHDWPLDHTRPAQRREALDLCNLHNITYLEDREIEVLGLRIYGSPWQPAFCGWAFNLPRNGWQLKRRWEMIPEGLDILITHGPPFGILDDGLGCELLRDNVLRALPKVHIFGHIHEGAGQCVGHGIASYNVAQITLNEPKPLVLELPHG